MENRRLAEARACLAKWLALDPESQPARGQLAAVQAGAAQLERLLAEARAASNALDTEGAVRKYEAVLQFTPDARGKAGPELAAVLARRALQGYQGRRFADAAGDLERAFSLDPALAARLENLYVASALSDVRQHLRELSAEQARERYARILAFAPTHPGLLYVAARLEEESSNLRGAAELYARALALRVSHPSAERVAELRRDLEKALGLKEAEGGVAVQPADDARYAQADPGNFQSLDLDRFTILHHNETLAAEVGRALEAHLERLQRASGLEPHFRQKVKVFLYRTQAEYTAATREDAVTGGMSQFLGRPNRNLTRPEIHSWQTSPRLLKSVLPHELMHLIVSSNLRRQEDLPRALHEGFAVWVEPEFRHRYYLDFLGARLRSQAFIPLNALLAMPDYPKDRDFFYAEGYALVTYLMEKHGTPKTVALITEAGKDAFGERLLALTAAPSLEELETRWRAWLRKEEQ